MKKIIVFLTLILAVTFANAQISVSSRHVGKVKKFSKNQLKEFKNTTTIFLLSNVFKKTEYKKILDKAWTVTPYEIVDINNFNRNDYLGGKYSFVELRGFLKTRTMKSGTPVDYLYMFLHIFMYDIEEVQKELKKELKKKKGTKQGKINQIYRKHIKSIARIDLFPTSDFMGIVLKESIDKIMEDVYEKDCFYTYELGFLQNMFQKVNSLIKKEETYWMYEDDYTLELKNLNSETLFVPSYLKIRYNPFKMKDLDNFQDDMNEKFLKYAYKYEFQDDSVLNERILNGEEFYYLRYARINSQKFIHIVNSKTGEIIYRDYETGFMYNFKGKYLKKLSKSIKKALKK